MYKNIVFFSFDGWFLVYEGLWDRIICSGVVCIVFIRLYFGIEKCILVDFF